MQVASLNNLFIMFHLFCLPACCETPILPFRIIYRSNNLIDDMNRTGFAGDPNS